MPSSNTEFGQIRVHVLYKRAEIPAKAIIPAIALSVTYRKQEKAENPGSTPVSATNPFRIICLQMGAQGLPLRRSVTDTAKARFQTNSRRNTGRLENRPFPELIRRGYPLPADSSMSLGC